MKQLKPEMCILIFSLIVPILNFYNIIIISIQYYDSFSMDKIIVIAYSCIAY